MRSSYAAAIAAVLLAVPTVTRAQPYFVRTPVPFTGPTRTYHVAGCGDGVLSVAQNAPITRIYCLDGTATVGVATPTGGGFDFFQVVLDMTGTRVGGFAGRFFDGDYSVIDFPTTTTYTGARTFTEFVDLAPAANFRSDPTGHATLGYALFDPVAGSGETEDGSGVLPDGIRFNSLAKAELAYIPQDAPTNSSADYGRALFFGLTMTETPEPATLALTLGGFAVLGAGAWQRRRAA